MEADKFLGKTGATGRCFNLEHGGDCGNDITNGQITPQQDATLAALASVVVDEMIRLKKLGKNPQEVMAIYDDRAMPTMPEGAKRRLRRQRKGAA